MSFELKALKDICTIQIGKTPSRHESDYWRDGTHAWLSIADMNQGRYLNNTKEYITDLGVKASNIKLIPKNTLVLSYKLSIGKVGITQKPMYTNEAIASLTELDSQVDINYLYWALQHIDLLENADRAAMGKTLNKAKLSEVKIPLPPLAEQRRIASILDQADELRQKRQQTIEKLDQLLQATFIDMFGDPEQNPKKWNKVILGDICDAKDRVNYGVVQPGNDFEGGIPLIRVGDIDGGILSFTSIKTIDPEIEKDYSRSRLKGNEILVSCVGSIGTIAKVPNKAIGFNIARAITRVPLQDKRIINFVAECLKTEAIQNYFKKNTRTVSQPTLNVSFVKETEIIFPNEEKILDFCKIVDKVEFQKELLQKALVMQESLFQSLQNQAFNGTL